MLNSYPVAGGGSFRVTLLVETGAEVFRGTALSALGEPKSSPVNGADGVTCDVCEGSDVDIHEKSGPDCG